MNIVGVYLAAGFHRRMGAINKLTLPFNRMPLGSSALSKSFQTKLRKILVVTKVDDSLSWIHPSLHASNRWEHITCPTAADGMAHSLQAGIRRAQALDTDAVIVMLADQPLITRQMINRLIDTYQIERQKRCFIDYIAYSEDGVIRPPVLIANRMFEALYQLHGDIGARVLLRDAKPENRIYLPVPDAKHFHDVDTMDDYKQLFERPVQPSVPSGPLVQNDGTAVQGHEV